MLPFVQHSSVRHLLHWGQQKTLEADPPHPLPLPLPSIAISNILQPKTMSTVIILTCFFLLLSSREVFIQYFLHKYGSFFCFSIGSEFLRVIRVSRISNSGLGTQSTFVVLHRIYIEFTSNIYFVVVRNANKQSQNCQFVAMR